MKRPSFALSRANLLRLGLVAVAVLFLAVIGASSLSLRTARIDLTEDRIYTLTPGTENIVDGLAKPLTLTLYFSEHATRELPQLRSYEQRILEMLREIAVRAHGRIRLRVIDPVPYSDDEDAAESYGLTPASGGSNGERVFFGLVGTTGTGDATTSQAIAFFDPAREAFVEYDIAKLLYELGAPRKPKIGVLSSLPVEGNLVIGEQPWSVVRQLDQLADVTTIDPEGLTRIDPSVNVLLLIHPKKLSDDAQYAIDQYVLHGGHLVVFVDPDAEMDTAPLIDSNGTVDDHDSDLRRLFGAWGVVYDPGKVVLDRSQALTIELNGNSVPHAAMLGLSAQDLNHDDVVTASLQRINVSTAGFFELAPDTKARLLPLVQTSDEATVVPSQRVRDAVADPSTLLENYEPSHDRYVVAARLRDTFHTAFPGRKGAGHLDVAAAPGEVVLIADTDLLSDRLWLDVQPLLGQQQLTPFANNGDFIANIVDNLGGSTALLSIRGRANLQRPFTRVRAMQAAADRKFIVKKRELENELYDTQRRLAELQPAKGAAATNTLTSQQRKEVEQYLQRKLAIGKELRDVQHQLNAEIDALGMRLKFINIVLVPALVALAGLLFGWRRTRRARREM
ncbi:GldG family protein [Luteibacter yeojuensis]|uniref:ABC transporter n=1 Tax=Luteibacter yeojuensis TaxID=345309 RepID=A0A0F3KT07_9GAMM|nr:Gldg family protein [Luteibacter yeojuensis]KJV34301.1 ABC transporter [Luteibacter yeojuensis]